MYNRLISLPKKHSFFLFGQRGVGKSHLINKFFENASLNINLLNTKIFFDLSATPWKIRDLVLAKKPSQEIVIIDEVQKIPALLDEVHLLIEEHKIVFGITGSSARKLKKHGVNLLAGRALNFHLHPLSYKEIDSDFSLEKVLQWGSLPKAYTENDESLREEYLHSYITNYLEQEIIIEQVVRNIEPFNRFLQVAAQCNTNVINYENIAADVKVTSVSVKSYFKILEDTLIGFFLPSYHTSVRKRQKVAPKFYFYDLGVVRALQSSLAVKPRQGTDEYGLLFESFIINEIVRLNEYSRSRYTFSHLRLDDKHEIDLIVERPGKKTFLIEIKSKSNIDERDIKRLEILSQSFKNVDSLCISQDINRRKIRSTICLPWRDAIEEIFG
jgi:predicted AAA+ superfamily ATPase